VTAAAALLLIVAIPAVMLIGTRSGATSAQRQFESGPDARGEIRISARATGIQAESDVVRSSPDDRARRAAPPLADPVSSELLHGVSGPELEGLLDLWESETRAGDQLSI
jgi:hypothetical protein